MNQRGVTLIELLIAVSLVSLLSLAGMIALRVGFSAMEKTDSRFLSNRRALGAQRALEAQIAGFMPVQAECPAPLQSGSGMVRFFQGEAAAMRFVSSYSLEEGYRGLPRILEYLVIPGDQGRGVRLVVNEVPYTGAASAGRFCLGVDTGLAEGISSVRWAPVKAGPRSFVLADKLAYCRISYKEFLREAPFERWTPAWTSDRRWPMAVRIEMAPLEPDPSRLLPMTITEPLRAQKVPRGKYE